MALVVARSAEDEKKFVADKLISLIGREAKKYKILALSDRLFEIKLADCVVGTATIDGNRAIVFQEAKTELGEEFKWELFRADPTLYWKVIYTSGKVMAFCGTDGGKTTKVDALQELTKEQFLAGARLVSYKNAGFSRGRLKTISSFVIRGEWPKCFVDPKEWSDLSYLI